MKKGELWQDSSDSTELDSDLNYEKANTEPFTEDHITLYFHFLMETVVNLLMVLQPSIQSLAKHIHLRPLPPKKKFVAKFLALLWSLYHLPFNKQASKQLNLTK